MDENSLINLFFRRTPRRKLVFSSSDDETDDSPQSISSGTNSSKFQLKKKFNLLFLGHILRQEHHQILQDEQ